MGNMHAILHYVVYRKVLLLYKRNTDLERGVDSRVDRQQPRTILNTFLLHVPGTKASPSNIAAAPHVAHQTVTASKVNGRWYHTGTTVAGAMTL